MNTLGMSNQQIIKRIDAIVNEEINDECIVVYSAYDYDDYGRLINNLEEVPVNGKVKFVSEDGEFESEILESPTWLDICVVANKMLKNAMDYQNRHFEDIDVFDRQNDIAIALLIMSNL
jgi:hypothetical protein